MLIIILKQIRVSGGLCKEVIMFVLYLEKYPQSLRGKLKTWLYEIKPALYVGTVSKRIRDLIWNQMIITEKDVVASMIFDCNNSQGFDVLTIGEPKKNIVDLYGVKVMETKKKITMSDFLAKTDTEKDLLAHLYEVAYTIEPLVNGPLKQLFDVLGKHIGCNITNDTERNALICVLSFVGFIHDVGKMAPNFQNQVNPKFQSDGQYYEKYETIIENNEYRHELYSAYLWVEFIKAKTGLDNTNPFREYIYNMIVMHHQKTNNNYIDELKLWDEMPEIKNIAMKTMEDGYNLFLAPYEPQIKQWTNNITRQKMVNGVLEISLSILQIADWMASTPGVYDNNTINNFSAILDYKKYLLAQCEIFLDKNKMTGDNLGQLFKDIKNDDSIWNLLIGSFEPRETQKTVASIPQSNDGPSLLFIEDVCGGGKTEAALYYALAQREKISGLYFALPTKATSENIHQRIRHICQLGIGKKYLIPIYTSSAHLLDGDAQLTDEYWECDAKLKMMYPIAVGTIDQLLQTIQFVRHSNIGLSALANKILIIDEMHAYDCYMLREIERLFDFCAQMNISIIVLSATLTQETKNKLINAYQGVNRHTKPITNSSQEYPLITYCHFDENKQLQYNTYPIKNTTQKEYRFEIIDSKEDDDIQCENVASLALNLVCEGGACAVVVNTVSTCVAIYDKLKNKIAGLDIELEILHSRYSIQRREEKTIQILNKYGKDRKNRPKKSILVSTQIIEQSLDVDFDYMISELCPIDLLWQRFGRNQRHADIGTIRECKQIKTPCYVFYKQGSLEKRIIYPCPIIKATLEYLRTSNGTLKMPDDIRKSIEAVYNSAEKSIEIEFENQQKSDKANQYIIPRFTDRHFARKTDMAKLHAKSKTRDGKMSTDVLVLTKEQTEHWQSLKDQKVAQEKYHQELLHDKNVVKTQVYSCAHAVEPVRLFDSNVAADILQEYGLVK